MSDIPTGLLEPVPSPAFDMAKMTGVTAAVITQIMRLAGLTKEVRINSKCQSYSANGAGSILGLRVLLGQPNDARFNYSKSY